MNLYIKKLFQDSNNNPSFLRLISLPVVLIGLFGFVFSIINMFPEGLIYSVSLITIVFGVKGYSKKYEEQSKE